MIHSRLANMLALPGSLLSGFFIYLELSHLLVPFRITAPLSIIMSLIIFGLTRYYSNERVNPFGAENKIFRGKFHSNLFFVIIYAIFIIWLFFNNQNTKSLFIPWEQFTELQIINLGIGISLSIFMSGYALVNVLDRKNELKILPKFLIAYILSALVTALTGFIWACLGFAVSDIKPILIGIHVVLLILFILDKILKKDFQSHGFQPNVFFEILKQNNSSVLVFGGLFALVILSTYCLYNGMIIGDQWTYHGKSLIFSSGAYKDFTALNIDEPYPPFLPAFLATFFVVSGVPSVNAYVSINFLNILPVIAFYYFFTKWFPNHRRAALLSSTLFMLSSGFGWAYVRSLTNSMITTQQSSLQIFHLGGLRTFDIWTPNTFIDVGHPDITTSLIVFALPAGFVLLGLLKENMNSKLGYFSILLGVLILGYLSHDEFGFFIITACVIPLILKLNGKNSFFAAIFTTILFAILDIVFLSGTYYAYRKILGVPLIILLLFFVSIMWTLYASKIMHKVYNIKILPHRTKKTIDRKTKIIIGVSIIFIFSYLYTLSFIIWNFIPSFDIRVDTQAFKIVPWYLLPLRFGVTGLLGSAFILSLIFRKYEREVIVLGVIGIVAFLSGPYYNEFRFDKYIMISFAGFASLLLFKILTVQSFLKPLQNGLIIGLVLTLSSLSILMYVGYSAIGVEASGYSVFDQDLPRRHFPSDITMFEFLHNNMNLKTDSVALTQNAAVPYSGIVSQLEGFVGLPLTKTLQSPNILQGTSLEGFYTLLDYNHMRYIVLPTEDIKRGLSEISSFALENFQKPYVDNDYVILSVPRLSPPSSKGDVTLLLPDTQYPVNSFTIFSNSTMDYKPTSLVSNSSNFIQVAEPKILSRSSTMWFDTSTKNVSYIEGRFNVIDENSPDNHSGIVWTDGNTTYYALLRSGKISIYNSDVNTELNSTTINREIGVWNTLKIVYTNDNIQILVNDNLELQIARQQTNMPHISKVGIRSYNDVTEFELLKVGQIEAINYDAQYHYYYPVSALALSKMAYQTSSDQDLSMFSNKNIIITVDPPEENKYLEFVKNGGNIIILNSDSNFNGEFSKMMSLELGKETKFDSIESSEGTYIKIFGTTSNIEIRSPDSKITSFYIHNDQKVAPLIIEKKYGDGKIIFVNIRGYFDAISQSPDQYFLTLGKIPDLLHLTAEKYESSGTNQTYIAQFVGGLQASGQIMVNGSSLLIPGNDFYNLTSTQYGSNTTNSSLLYENGSNYVKIHDLNLYGPFNISINSTTFSYIPLSEFGYVTLSFPAGFDMAIKLANGSRADFSVDNSNQISEVIGQTIQFKGVKIQPIHSYNTILMRNPEIIINGNTTFDDLYSTNPTMPTDPTAVWAAGVPVKIVGRLAMNIDHIDNDATNGRTPMTYFKWISIDNVPDIPQSTETIDIPWKEIMLSKTNFIAIGVLAIISVISGNMISRTRKAESNILPRSKEAVLMDLFGRSKKSEKIESEEEIQIKTPEQTPKKTLQDELEQIKNEVQDALATLSATSYQLKNVKDEYDLELKKLAESKKELESSKTEISKLRSEHQSLLEEIQSTRTDLVTIKAQYDQKEAESIKEKIESINDELSEINSKKNNLMSEVEEIQHKIESAKTEFNEINSKIKNEKSELSSLQSQQEAKTKEIMLAKKELAFIENELASVGKESDTKKIMEAAGSVVASINAKYESIKKELEIIKTAYTRLKTEHETIKNELDALKNKDK